MEIHLTSPVFENAGMIPAKYTCDGENVSPPLIWDSVPEGTKSIALICDDPDAPGGTFVHWVLYNLPADMKELPEDIPHGEVLKNAAKQGITDFGRIGYGGPCPPKGVHRYFFKIYFLDSEVGLSPGASKTQLLQAIGKHIKGQGQLVGKYKRK